jgi:hypothetical protein
MFYDIKNRFVYKGIEGKEGFCIKNSPMMGSIKLHLQCKDLSHNQVNHQK